MSRAANWSIHQQQLSDVLLVDHAENWLFLSLLLFGVDDLALHSRCFHVVAVRRDQLASVVLGHSFNSSQRLGQAGGVETVDVRLDFTLLYHQNRLDLRFLDLGLWTKLVRYSVYLHTSSLQQSHK